MLAEVTPRVADVLSVYGRRNAAMAVRTGSTRDLRMGPAFGPAPEGSTGAQALFATVDEGVARARDLVDLGAEMAHLSCCHRAGVAIAKAFEIAGSSGPRRCSFLSGSVMVCYMP